MTRNIGIRNELYDMLKAEKDKEQRSFSYVIERYIKRAKTQESMASGEQKQL